MALITLRALAREAEHFLELKRALGHPYHRGAFTVRSFLRYAALGGRRQVDLERTLRAWLARSSGRKPVSVTVELGTLRQFLLYRRRSDPAAFVPDRTWAPQSTVSDFLPYVLTYDEVCQLIKLKPAVRHPLRASTLRTILVVLYCTGLRPGEAVRLDLADLDLHDRCFRIRESKGKTRFVPFGDDLAEILRAYLRERATVARSTESGPLFVRPDGSAVPIKVASEAVRRHFCRCRLKPPRGRIGPRPYDMRHTFAVHRLTKWYRDGVDVHSRLPWLSAYMGHDDLLGTEAYLTATAELLALAAERFEQRYRGESTR
jgi:integrase/recombinase XerD